VGGGNAGVGWRMRWRHRSETAGRRERAYARSMFMGLVTQASRGGRIKESQRWGWRSFACADCMSASREEGEGG
jgi:hypothetical protein